MSLEKKQEIQTQIRELKKKGVDVQTAATQVVEGRIKDLEAEHKSISKLVEPKVEKKKAEAPIQEEIAKEIDTKAEEKATRGAVGLNLKEPKKVKKKYKFANPDTEKRYQQAKKNIQPGILSRIAQGSVRLRNKITREYEHLPKNKEFSQLRFDLLRLAKQKGVSAEKSINLLRGITQNLNRYEYDLFNRKLLLEDFVETAKEGKELPYGYKDIAGVEADLKSLNKATFGNEKIEKALSHRRRVMESIKGDYIKAMKNIGYDVSKKLTRKAYFRHQVLEYASAKNLFGIGKKLKTPRGRGFLKHRKGSALDIYADYIQAEHEVFAQMLYDTEVANTIDAVRDNYDISHVLKQRAKDKNYEMIVGGPENVNRLNQLRGEKAEILASKPLDSSDKQQLKFINEEIWDLDPTMPFRQRIAMHMAKLQKELGIDEYFEPESEYDELMMDLDFSVIKAEADKGSLPAKGIFKAIAERDKFMRKELGKDYLYWKNEIDPRLFPSGYTDWQPAEGNVFYMADSVPAKISKAILEGQLEEIGVTAEDLKPILAMGGKRRQFIVKEEVAETLDNMVVNPSVNVIAKGHKKLIRGWKIWQLISPRRYVKYNFRNLTGDADAAFAGRPSVFNKVPQAYKELADVYINKKTMKGDLLEWFERGGMEGVLQAQEMGQIKKLDIFKNLHARRGVKDIPIELWKQYWKKARLSTDFREALLRFAAYKQFKAEMKASKNNLPKDYGASIPDEIKGLQTIEDRAYWLSNDLLGAYDRVGAFGRALRDHLFPFWSWKEVNFRRYNRMMRNAASDQRLVKAVGKKTLGSLVIKTPYRAWKISKWILRAVAFLATLQAWNTLRFPEEEKELPQSVRNKPHIILGRNPDGTIDYFSRVGALGDLLEWFGLDEAPRYTRRVLDGKMSVKEAALEMAKQPVNVFAQGAEPFAKTAAELVTRRSLFPDVFRPGTVRDRVYHVARGVGLENEYKALAGKPSRGYKKSLKNFFHYQVDPLEAAYRDIVGEKYAYMRKIGKYGEGFWLTPKGNALYDAKLAVRYGDRVSAEYYMKQYYALGGTPEGFFNSLMNMNPLSGMSLVDQVEFTDNWLNDEEREKLVMAIKFWEEIILLDPDMENGK